MDTVKKTHCVGIYHWRIQGGTQSFFFLLGKVDAKQIKPFFLLFVHYFGVFILNLQIND